MRKTAILALGFLWSLSSATLAAPVKEVSTDMGTVLAGENDMTLYTFRKDETGISNCYDKCAELWPPLLASDGATAEGAYSIITRTDGTRQWAKDGMPLYFWAKDINPGDTTGNGVKGVWDVAKP